MRQSPGGRRWGPGCTRDTHRHAVSLLPDGGYTCYLEGCGFLNNL